MPVSYEELTVPSMSGDLRGMKAERTFLIAQSDTMAFLEELVGSYSIAGNAIVRSGLATYPGADWLTLESWTVAPFHDRITGVDPVDGVAVTDAGVVVKAVYSTKDYDQDDRDPNNPGAFISHQITGSHQRLEHSNSALKWETPDNGADGGKTSVPPDILPGCPITIVDHEITWKHVVNPPFARIFTLCGKVNIDPFLGHHDETVLLNSFSASRQIIPGNVMKWDITYQLQARVVPDDLTIGWNHFLQPNPKPGKKWVRIVHAEDGAKLLPTADFSTLFQHP